MRRRIQHAIREFRALKLKHPRLTVRPTDGFIVSWPRSGNTWMRHLLLNAVYPDEQHDGNSMQDRMPNVAFSRLPQLLPTMDAMPARLFKSHDWFLPFYLQGRVAYLVRNGQDAMTSFYHYRTTLNSMKHDWPEFLAKTLTEKFRYGSWHHHIESWLPYQDHPNVLFVYYEHMLADTQRELSRVLEHFRLDVPADRIAAAVERSSVEHVNQGFQQRATGRGRQFSGGLGGGSGKSKQRFSPADTELFMRYSANAMEKMGYTSKSVEPAK